MFFCLGLSPNFENKQGLIFSLINRMSPLSNFGLKTTSFIPTIDWGKHSECDIFSSDVYLFPILIRNLWIVAYVAKFIFEISTCCRSDNWTRLIPHELNARAQNNAHITRVWVRKRKRLKFNLSSLLFFYCFFSFFVSLLFKLSMLYISTLSILSTHSTVLSKNPKQNACAQF